MSMDGFHTSRPVAYLNGNGVLRSQRPVDRMLLLRRLTCHNLVMSLQSGVYTIANAKHCLFASLPNNNGEQAVVGIGPDGPTAFTDAEKWEIINTGYGGRYRIQNIKYKCDVGANAYRTGIDGPQAQVKKDSTRRYWWKLEQVDEHYRIYPAHMPELCWSLREECHETPILFETFHREKHTLWEISNRSISTSSAPTSSISTRPIPTSSISTRSIPCGALSRISSVYPDQTPNKTHAKQPGATPDKKGNVIQALRESPGTTASAFLEALPVHLKLAEATPSEDGVEVKIVWDRYPSGCAILFMGLLSVVYRGIVIAEAIQGDEASESSSYSDFAMHLKLEIKRSEVFDAFVASVAQEEEVQVVLRVDDCRFVRQAKVITNDRPFRLERLLTFKGFGATEVKLSDLRIVGSDSNGEYMDSKITVDITNPSNINATVSMTVYVYFNETQIGTASIRELLLRPGRNRIESLGWMNNPPHSANADIKEFVNRYFTTRDMIPVRLHVQNCTTVICGDERRLPPFKKGSVIEGLGSDLIPHVEAYVGRMLMFCNLKKVSFVFECKNPMNAPLTIHEIRMVARARGLRITAIHRFEPDFAIPVSCCGRPRPFSNGRQQSGETRRSMKIRYASVSREDTNFAGNMDLLDVSVESVTLRQVRSCLRVAPQ
ncbi:hypothetical protein AcV7_002020 [Taiwanofungus camphoratus]|nr:hypothetical protein AcV7_002020 [Antrodia cinnamomea]